MTALKKLKQDTGDLIGTGVGLGVGSSAIGNIAEGTAIESTVGGWLSNIASQQVLLGSIVGAGALLGVTKEAFDIPKKKLEL